jgi:hypothetical protein
VSDQSVLGADRLKHLEFIQAIVTRLGTSSFLIKGWTLTIAAAFFAVLMNRLSWGIAVAGLVPLVAFWFLDGTFLRNERRFRLLYNDARRPDTSVEVMSMDLKPYAQNVTWASATFSSTLMLFYGALVLLDVALGIAALVAGPQAISPAPSGSTPPSPR